MLQPAGPEIDRLDCLGLIDGERSGVVGHARAAGLRVRAVGGVVGSVPAGMLLMVTTWAVVKVPPSGEMTGGWNVEEPLMSK